MIPEENMEGVEAVRIGMLHEQRYWVESLYPEHPCTVKIMSCGELSTLNARLAAAARYDERQE